MIDGKFLQSREITERWLISADLVLLTPAHFGSGKTTDLLDMPLLVDATDGSALLPGTSLTGALRNYLCLREAGYAAPEQPNSLGTKLFGYQSGSTGEQSWLIAEDSLSGQPESTVRDGIARDPVSNTVEAKKKFDFEILAPATKFKIEFELLTTAANRNELLKALAVALQGFELSEIHLGARKSRGLGKCKVSTWHVVRYELNDRIDLERYLKKDVSREKTGTKIAEIFHEYLQDEFKPEQVNSLDARHFFEITATFALKDSLLIRSGGSAANDPDFVNLSWKTRGNTNDSPILSGSSLAGALRHRAYQILDLIPNLDAPALVEEVFGRTSKQRSRFTAASNKSQPTGSRLWVSEQGIDNPAKKMVQSRIKIDRLTGGVINGALFNMEPVFAKGQDKTTVKLSMRLIKGRNDHGFPAKAGLLLHLLKDLWLSDLPLGGEVSIGRGRLKGLQAKISLDQKVWNLFINQDDSLGFDPPESRNELEEFSASLLAYTQKNIQTEGPVVLSGSDTFEGDGTFVSKEARS